MSVLLEVKDLRYNYPDGSAALSGVSFRLAENEKLALIGANGSGKSTLLLHLSGCLPAHEGSVLLNGKAVGNDLESLRKASGLVFQEPDDQLFMPSVLEDVAFGLVARKMGVPEAHSAAHICLEELGVAHLASRPPHRLSGGEKRMVALAGIWVMQPQLVLLDEPSAALDPRARRHVIDVLKGLDKTLILATHDLDMALDVCDRALILRHGTVAATGALPDLLQDAALLDQNGLELPLRYQAVR